MNLYGRTKIIINEREITASNIAAVLGKVLAIHAKNRSEIQYLYDYYRGRQKILNRVKPIRPEICNKVTVNRANEIVTFKTAYLFGEPLQYISNGGDDTVSKNVNTLNEFMRAEDKDSKDKEVADWMHICGVGVRMVLPDKDGEKDGSPVCIYTLDPRDAFVIYNSGVGQKPIAGVIRQRDERGSWYSCVYTSREYFEVGRAGTPTTKAHTLGRIPIIEYLNNDARIGAFEVVLSQLDAINTLESNRIDAIEQRVQSFLVFENCDIDKETFAALRVDGAIKVKGDAQNPSKVYAVDVDLSQDGIQKAIDDQYDEILTICGMPNRNGGSSTSDTGQAVLYRDGFESAESRAKDTEKTFRRSEREFLRLVLHICNGISGLELELSQIKPEFTRKNFANTQSKSQVLAQMLGNEKIHPKLAFTHSGMFTDAEEAYRISMEWYEKNGKPAVTDKTVERSTLNSQGGERTPEQKTQEEK